jgi:2-dehydro-3-deoxy-D-gluconate 5-dehydrogenase
MLNNLSAFGLNDQIAVVTGASQGIGRCLAINLAKAGARVVLVDINRTGLDEVSRLIDATGNKSMFITTDIRKVDQIQSMADQVESTYGQVDILINDAAWTDTVPAFDVTEEEWDQTIDTSLKGTFFVSQAIARIMKKKGKGKIINMGSSLGEVAFTGRSVYGAAKGGLHQLTRVLAFEWAPFGINVNAVAPCITETPSRRHLFEKPGYKEWVTEQMLPIKRWAQPEDIVGAVLFLSSSFSDMVVGHILMVDGGWTIH